MDVYRLSILYILTAPLSSSLSCRSVMAKKHDEPPKEPKDAAEGGQSGVLEIETILRVTLASNMCMYALVSVCGSPTTFNRTHPPLLPTLLGLALPYTGVWALSEPRQMLSLSLWSCDVRPCDCLAHWRSEIEKTRGGPRQSYYFTQTESHEVG